MRNELFLLLSIMIISSTGYAYSQEPGLATFQETAQVIIDKTISGNISASITLQSTSIQEIKIPAELEQKIRENNRMTERYHQAVDDRRRENVEQYYEEK